MTREEIVNSREYSVTKAAIEYHNNNLSTDSMTAFEEGAKWADEHPDGSIIHWRKGIPKEDGRYMITTIDGHIATAVYLQDDVHDKHFFDTYVAAWCKLSDIKPYKEDES